MSVIASAIRLAERTPLPDRITERGISFLVGRTARRLAASPEEAEQAFTRDTARSPIALDTGAANAQHYELPPAFFEQVLGPRRKYSCCLYPTGAESLAEAEELALEQTIRHADLCDGQDILELGCGWGSLTLFMAERFPRARILAVSNSVPQRRHIEAQAAARGLTNVRVLTRDMNAFEPEGRFDRIVSVEMFEHMSNWRLLLERMRDWLAADGRLFIHIFAHRSRSYRFDRQDSNDWIAQHFFTGGIMPSNRLITRFDDCFVLEREWAWNGQHYQRTAMHWLANFDRNMVEVNRILRDHYGDEAAVWRRRWRLFFLATAGLFGHGGGEEWAVHHYLLRPAR